MDTSFYLAYAGMQADMRAVEIAAHNLANLNTNGFREERSFVSALSAAGGEYPRLEGTRTKREPGALVSTGRELDVAIEGDGYLVVDTPSGRRYTRDGGLSLDEDGTLVTRSGYPLAGQGGAIRVPPGRVVIDADGRVMVERVSMGRILVVGLPPTGLSREEGALYRLETGQEISAPDAELRQGFLEQSNVKLSTIEISQLARHFQSLSRALQTVNGLERQLVSTARGK